METVPSSVPNIKNHPDSGGWHQFPAKPAQCPVRCYFLMLTIDSDNKGHHYHCTLSDSLINGAGFLLQYQEHFVNKDRYPGAYLTPCPVDVEFDGQTISVPNQSDPDIVIDMTLEE